MPNPFQKIIYLLSAIEKKVIDKLKSKKTKKFRFKPLYFDAKLL